MILITLSCTLCDSAAGVGMNVQHALENVVESGGRVFGETLVCTHCAEATR
jgi:hypothetical protein